MLVLENLTESYEYRQLVRFVESLTELISRTDKIKNVRDYIDDFDPNRRYSEYETDPNVVEVKQDLMQMFSDIKAKLQNIPNVSNVSYHASPKFGLSNYVKVHFRKNVHNKDYNANYGSKYDMDIKISDHFTSTKGTDNIDIVGKSYNEIEQEIIRLVKERSNWLSQMEGNWNKKQSGKKHKGSNGYYNRRKYYN